MKNLIKLMLVFVLGMSACDKDSDTITNNQPSIFESFRIGVGDSSSTILEFIKEHENATGKMQDGFYVFELSTTDHTFKLLLEEDYGCVMISNCYIDNYSVDYEKFKQEILKL